MYFSKLLKAKTTVSIFLFVFFVSIGTAQDRVDSISPYFELAPGVNVQVGIIGTDPLHDAEPIATVKIAKSGINAAFGKGKEGVLFDFKVSQPIVDGLSYSLATRNHGWKSQGFFNDHKAVLTYIDTPIKSERTVFRFRPEVFVASANQQLAGELVSSARLGFELTGDLSHDLQAFGKVRLINRNRFSYYHETSDWQYAFRVLPSWAISVYDHRLVTSVDFQLANAASPFDGHVDRQGDINTLKVAWHYEPENFFFGSLKSTFGVSVNWLKDVENDKARLRSAYWILDTTQVIDKVVWDLQLELQTAAFLTAVQDPDIRASLSVDTDLYYHHWRYHFKGEYKFLHPDDEKDIEQFELGLGPVIELDNQRFRPYIAINVAELLFNDGAIDSIALTGIGFEVLQ